MNKYFSSGAKLNGSQYQGAYFTAMKKVATMRLRGEGVSFNDIAKIVCVNRSTLYSYFIFDSQKKIEAYEIALEHFDEWISSGKYPVTAGKYFVLLDEIEGL